MKNIINNKGFSVEPGKTEIWAWLLKPKVFKIHIDTFFILLFFKSKADKQQQQKKPQLQKGRGFHC